MDGIILVSKEERFAFKSGKSKIFYRRVSPAYARTLREMHTTNGVVNNEAVGDEAIRYAVTGWQNVKDVNGKEVPFDSELLDNLPSSERNALAARIIGGDYYEELENQEKN